MLVKKELSRKTRGFTLTEVAIVLGIVGLILGAIWVAAAAVYNNQRVATTSTQLVQMVNAIRSTYATTPVIPAQLTAANGACDLANAGAMPRDMVALAATGICASVTNVWGGTVQVTTPAANSNTFTVAISSTADIPNEACRALVMRIGGAGHDEGLTTITGSGGNVGGITLSRVMALTDAGSICGNGNSILSFTFNLR